MSKKKPQPYGRGGLYRRESDGRWIGTIEAGFTESGARRRIYVTAKTEAECKRRLRDRRRQFEAGDRKNAQRVTVKSWADDYLEITQTRLRPKTWATDRGQIKKWVVPTIGQRPLADLTVADVRAVQARMRAAGKASSSRLRCQNVLLKMLKDAVAEGHTVPGHVLSIKPAQKQGDVRDKAKGKRQALTMDEVRRIWTVLEQRPDRSRYAIPFLEGLRQGETLGLTWDRIDLDAGEMFIEWQLQMLPYLDSKDRSKGFRIPDDYEVRQLVKSYHLVRPKTKAGVRKIPLIPEAGAVLREWQAVAPANPHGLVWSRPNGMPINLQADALAWRDIQDAAEVRHPDGRHYHLHEIRNTTATILMELGVDRVYIEAIMGHSDLVTSYVTVNPEPLRQALTGVWGKLTAGD